MKDIVPYSTFNLRPEPIEDPPLITNVVAWNIYRLSLRQEIHELAVLTKKGCPISKALASRIFHRPPNNRIMATMGFQHLARPIRLSDTMVFKHRYNVSPALAK